MGAAGCARAREHFAWARIITSFENLWRGQEDQRRAAASSSGRDSRWRGSSGPAAYPSPEQAFAGYPTRCLDSGDRVLGVPGSTGAGRSAAGHAAGPPRSLCGGWPIRSSFRGALLFRLAQLKNSTDIGSNAAWKKDSAGRHLPGCSSTIYFASSSMTARRKGPLDEENTALTRPTNSQP